MKVADKLVIIHPDDTNRYVEVNDCDIRADSSTIKFPMSETPSWEKEGMQVVCSDDKGNIICTGLVKNIKEVKVRTPKRRKYEVMNDGSNVMGLNP